MKKARIIEEHKTNYIILDNKSEFIATVRGSFFTGNSFPKVGDFVEYTELDNGKAVIEEVLPRSSMLMRKSTGTDVVQVLVANVDIILIVMGLDNDFNLNRLERYLLLAKQSEVRPVIILNKSDAVTSVEEYINSVKSIARDVDIHAVSASNNINMEVLLSYFKPETTAVLLGSSGVGKSTITNWLLNEDKQEIKEVRLDDSRGRHTTTSRQLFSLPSGGYLIDTPGMRELSVVDTNAEDEQAVFTQFDELSKQCQFSNCDHEKSKGCAILSAIESGEVSDRQLRSYQKIKKERLFEESKHDSELSYKQKQDKKKLFKNYKGIAQKKKFKKGK